MNGREWKFLGFYWAIIIVIAVLLFLKKYLVSN